MKRHRPITLINARVDIGQMKSDIKEHSEFQARRAGSILECKSDGYYDTEKCRKDFKKASDIVRKNYKGNRGCVFITHNAPIQIHKKSKNLKINIFSI